MFYILLTLIFAIIVASYIYGNRVRGKEPKPAWSPTKATTYIYLAALFGLCHIAVFQTANGSIPWVMIAALMLVDFLGNLLGWMIGHGQGFPHGKNYSPAASHEPTWQQKDFAPAKWIASLIVGKYEKEMPMRWVQKWQTVWMCARYGICFTPKFIALAGVYYLFTGSLLSWLQALIGALLAIGVGYAYYLAFHGHEDEDRIPEGEHYAGVPLGIATALGIIILGWGA